MSRASLRMRARVVSGTDGVSVLLSTSDTAACETPAASAMSFWVGRELKRSPPRGVRVDDIIPFSYTYYYKFINKLVPVVLREDAPPCQLPDAKSLLQFQ